MRITKLQIENILKIKLINIVPKNDIIEIQGENEQEKFNSERSCDRFQG